MADRIVIMKDGRIQQVGTPAEVYHAPANTFVAQFIGAPSMNMLPGRAEGGAVVLETGARVTLARVETGAAALAKGRQLLVGVRPEDLHPAGDGVALISGRVAVAEPLGSETLLHVSVGGQEVIAAGPGRDAPKVGDMVGLAADPAALHLFDAETGQALA